MSEQKWLVCKYRPAGIFSLRQTTSTSSGGKSLLVPSPYAVILAMVDAAYRVGGEEKAFEVFTLLHRTRLYIKPPTYAVVTNTFVKVKRENRDKEKDPLNPYITTINFREQVFFRGVLKIAFAVNGLSVKEINLLKLVASHINYFGKRSSFFQFSGVTILDKLEGYSIRVPDELSFIDPTQYGIMQFLDELGEGKTEDLFRRINTYSDNKMTLGKHRVLQEYLLPYKMVENSDSFTYYATSSGGLE